MGTTAGVRRAGADDVGAMAEALAAAFEESLTPG